MEFVEVLKAIVPNKFDPSKFIQAFANPGTDGGSFEVPSEVKHLKVYLFINKNYTECHSNVL